MERKIGSATTSAMGMGCWAIGGPFWDGETPLGWGDVDDNESIAAVHACLDLGVSYFDTANVYGAGHSERVLAEALAGRRESAFISTKFGILFDEESKQVTGTSAQPKVIRTACEDSLRRLGTDWIDLYFFHLNGHPVDEAGPVRETLEDLVREGKIRSYGWSTDFHDAARFFSEGDNCVSIQFQMNVVDHNDEMVDICEHHDLAAVLRGPLAMGLLTGKYKAGAQLGPDDVRGTRSPEWMQYFTDGAASPRWMKRIEAVREILTSGGRSLVQGALAWLWARSTTMIPIPGIRTAAQARENCKALDHGPLTASQMREIETILDGGSGE